MPDHLEDEIHVTFPFDLEFLNQLETLQTCIYRHCQISQLPMTTAFSSLQSKCYWSFLAYMNSGGLACQRRTHHQSRQRQSMIQQNAGELEWQRDSPIRKACRWFLLFPWALSLPVVPKGAALGTRLCCIPNSGGTQSQWQLQSPLTKQNIQMIHSSSWNPPAALSFHGCSKQSLAVEIPSS